MWARLVCLLLCILPALGQVVNWTSTTFSQSAAPEPRSFATLSGFPNGSAAFLYGGFSHARSAWLDETWRLNLGSAPLWDKLGPSGSSGPLQHATLVTVGNEVLLVGGRDRSGHISDKLYKLDLAGADLWVPVVVQGGAAPPLYRHTAVSYTVGGSLRALLCGGLNAVTNATVDTVYELSYNATGDEYIFSEMSPMPRPLFGHSLAAGADSEVLLSGGLSGSFGALPTAALPPQLAAIMDRGEASGAPLGAGNASASASAVARVYRFRRNASAMNGSWSDLGSAARPTAFHASWVAGSLLYMHGGAQGRAENSSIALYGLQVLDLSNVLGTPERTSLSNVTAVQEALDLWGAVQPSSLSGAALWVNANATGSGLAQTRVCLFGGWATPQRLPSGADAYLSPQDSSLTWRLAGSGEEALKQGPGKWFAPLQGGIAPRGAAGVMTVPVTVGGDRKLLLLGGRAAKGWTGVTPEGSGLMYAPEELQQLSLPPGNTPLDSALSYQLYDMWLIDPSTGKAEAVWLTANSKSSIVSPSPRPPFGTSATPAAVGRLWDRRLLECYPAGGGALGDGDVALYLQAEEEAGAPNLQPGIWGLSLTVTPLKGADRVFNTTVATWRSLLPPGAVLESDSAACYPRVLYGAAHLVSTSNTASYIALHGGLVSSAASLWSSCTASSCLLELGAAGPRWLRQPSFSAGAAPSARYRHACASRPGLSNYSMTCYGGVDRSGRKALADAWTLSLQPGISFPAAQFIGSWAVAPANLSAVRPGPRVDHWMVSLRGAASPATSPEAYSPVLLVGGSASVTAVDGAAPPPPPHQAVWLLEAADCNDPDAADPLAGATQPPYRSVQVWLSVLPGGEPGLRGAANAVANVSPPLERWALAAAALVKGKSGPELWLLLAEAAPGAVSDLRGLRAVFPATGGCLSTSLRPNCTSLSYAYDAAKVCWPESSGQTLRLHDVLSAANESLSRELFQSSGGLVLLDTDGSAVHFEARQQRAVTGVQTPPGLSIDDLTIVAYGKPYIELNRTSAAQNLNITLPPGYKVCALLRFANGTAIVNATAELRVRDGDGLTRRRRSLMLYPTVDVDRRPTSASGAAEFNVMNISAVPQPSNVSYVVVFTLSNNKSYSAVLQSPEEARRGWAAPYSSSDGVTTALLQRDRDAVYNITLTTSSPTTDNLTAVSFNVSFRSPNTTARLPTKRYWRMDLFLKRSAIQQDLVYSFLESYGKKPARQMLEPGSYFLEMADANITSYDLKPFTSTFAVPPAASPPPASSPMVVPLTVPMSAVWLSVSFNGMLAPSAWGAPKPLHVMVALVTETFRGGGAREEVYWDEVVADDVPWALLPGVPYRATFRFPSQSLPLLVINFTAPPLLVLDSSSSGSSSSISSGSGSGGGYLRLNVTLPQVLLCGSSPETQVTFIDRQKGRIPAGGSAPVAYVSDTICIWRITTGQPILNLRINYSGLGSTDMLLVSTDSGVRDRLVATVGTYFLRELVPNVSIIFRTGNDSVLDYFVVEWEGQAQGGSMPPQFIMMIAASSAAAGAMLLFLCLWHCVFRPVQLRRQQAAAAMAAAAAASAAGNAAGNAAAGRGANRTRVPRRYLRLMATSVYSAKDSAAAAAATAAAASTTATVTASASASATATVRPSSASPERKDSAKLCTADAADATPPTQPGQQGSADGTTTLTRPPSARLGGGGGAPAVAMGGAMAAAASSAPASHSEPEGAGSEVCSICLCEFEDGDRIKHLPCKHFYHATCIDQWLSRDITCPLCKDNVLDALKSLFGPLPTRGGGSGGSGGGGSGGGGGGGIAAQQVQAGDDEAAGAAAAADGGGGGGAALPAGADLEMVVILPPEHAAAAGGGRGGSGGSGGDTDSAALPGSVGGQRDPGAAVRQPVDLEAMSRGGSGEAGGTRTVLVVNAAAAAASGEGPSANGGGGTAAPAAAAGGPGALQLVSSSHSRELRPMRRNISADLTAERYGTSSDSESDSEAEYGIGTRSARGGASGGAGGGGAAVNSPRVFQVVPPPPSFSADSGGDGSLGSGGGNQLALALAAPAGGQVALSPYFETGGLVPSPRPVAEHVQRSSSSSSTAMRWISGSSQVAPMPRQAAAQFGAPAVHRLARAQEAQMAVAAAAFSAAAAGVSSGGVGGAGGGSGFSAATGANSWLATSSTSITGATPYQPSFDGGSAAAAAAAAAPFRVHHNPLALGSASSRSENSSPRALDAPALPAADRPSGSASPSHNPAGGAASGAHTRSQQAPVSVPLGGGGLGLLSHASAHPTGLAAASGSSRRRPSSAASAASATAQPRAVPEVSSSCEDLVRVPPASAASASSLQQLHPLGRATTLGLGLRPWPARS